MKNIFCLLFAFISLQFSAQSFHFEHRWNGTGTDVARKVLTSPTGYIIGGYSDSSGTGRNALLMFLDQSGNETSSFLYGGFGFDMAYDMKRCSDSSFIFAGYTRSFTASGMDSSNAFLLRVSSTGTILWSAIYGGSGDDAFHSVCQNSDGGFTACGYTNSFGQGSRDMFVVRTDASGNATWMKSYGTPGNETANCVNETSSHMLILTGSTDYFAGGNQILAMKLRSDGVAVLSGRYDFTASVTSLQRTGNCVIETTGGYIVTGKNGMGAINDAQAFAMKTDTSGFPLWANSYTMNSGDGNAFDIVPDGSGGFAIAGVMGNYYPALIHINAGGSRDWSWYYSDGAFNTKGQCFSVTASNGEYTIAGHKETGTDTALFITHTDGNGSAPCNSSSPSITQDLSLSASPSTSVFTSSNGGSYSFVTMIWTVPVNSVQYICNNTGMAEAPAKPVFEAFPNPATDELTIRCENETEKMQVQIMDAAGRLVYASMLQEMPGNGAGSQTTLSTRNMEPGFYFVRLAGTNGSSVQKIVIAR